jgi:hypothetical protein
MEQSEHDMQIGSADIQVYEDHSFPHTRQHQAKIACHDTFADSTFAGCDGNNRCHSDIHHYCNQMSRSASRPMVQTLK